MEKLLDIFNAVKSDFCELTTYKVRNNSIEIITPFSTLNNKFISVFVKYSQNQLIISDGGWIDLNYYEVNINEESEAIIDRVTSYYLQNYQINTTSDNAGTLFYFKVCKSLEEIYNRYSKSFELFFANGGDQDNKTIPEVGICKKLGIKLLDGLGSKIQSSSWLINSKDENK